MTRYLSFAGELSPDQLDVGLADAEFFSQRFPFAQSCACLLNDFRNAILIQLGFAPKFFQMFLAWVRMALARRPDFDCM